MGSLPLDRKPKERDAAYMGLRNVRLVLMSMTFIAATGCVQSRQITRTEKGVNRRYYDCCSPSLQADAKLGCNYAFRTKNYVVLDDYGDEHIFTWSDCKPGEERWREWE